VDALAISRDRASDGRADVPFGQTLEAGEVAASKQANNASWIGSDDTSASELPIDQ
jgi:hypothetical protein